MERTNAGRALILGLETYGALELPHLRQPEPGRLQWSVFGNLDLIRGRYVQSDLSWERRWLKLESSINNLTDRRYFTCRATGYPGFGIIPSNGRAYFLTTQGKIEPHCLYILANQRLKPGTGMPGKGGAIELIAPPTTSRQNHSVCLC